MFKLIIMSKYIYTIVTIRDYLDNDKNFTWEKAITVIDDQLEIRNDKLKVKYGTYCSDLQNYMENIKLKYNQHDIEYVSLDDRFDGLNEGQLFVLRSA